MFDVLTWSNIAGEVGDFISGNSIAITYMVGLAGALAIGSLFVSIAKSRGEVKAAMRTARARGTSGGTTAVSRRAGGSTAARSKRSS